MKVQQRLPLSPTVLEREKDQLLLNIASHKFKRTVSTNQVQGKHIGLTRPFMQADITVETDEREEVIIIDDDSDTTYNEKELLIQFLLDFKALLPDGTYRDYLRQEKVNITKLQNFLRERGCSMEDLSSYEFTMLQYLTLEEEDLILEEGEKKKYRKPCSDCARGFKNFILEDSTPAEFIANNFMFKNDNTSVCRHEISMEDLFKLYRFLALDKSFSQEYIVTQIRKATADLCNEYECGYFLYSFLQKSGGSEKTLQGLIDVGIVQKEDLEKNNVYFGTLLLPFLQTHACLKILIEWYPDHLRPSDIVKSVQPNEKDSSVVSVDDLKLVFTLAKKHFPQWLGFLLETDKSQNRSNSGMESRGHDFHTSPCREICNMKTKQNEALEAIIGCLDEADLSLLVDMVKELHDVGRRIEAKTCDYIQKELRVRIEKSKCEHTHLMKSVVHKEAGVNKITNATMDICPDESSKMTRSSFDRQTFESLLDRNSKLVSEQSECKFKKHVKSLRDFHIKHGHFNVTKIHNSLYNWLLVVKKSYKMACQGKKSTGWKLTRERYDKLISIGFTFEIICLPTSRNEKDVHTKIPSTLESNHQSVSEISILQEANKKRTKKAASNLSSSSKSQLINLNKEVHTASKPKCPLAQDGNLASENNKQDVEYICNEHSKNNEKTKSTAMTEASVEIRKKLNEKEYVHNTLASSNGAGKPIPSKAVNTVSLPQKHSESLMTSYSPKQTCNEILRGDVHMENRPVDSRLNEMKEEYDTIKRKKNEEIDRERRIRRELENRLILQDQESEAAQMKKEDKINELVTENSSLQKKLVDMKMTLMEKLVIEKSSLEQQLKSEINQHDETKRKLTDRVMKADEKRELQKKTEKRLVEENISLRIRYKALKSDNQKLVDQNKSLKESSAANTTSLSSSKEHSLLKRMITKKEPNEMKDRLQILSASNKEVIDENEQLRQKLEEFEQLKKFKSGLQEKLVCPVCFKGMKNPQMTKCGHRFCKTCIEKEIRKAVPYGREKRCPTCRDPIVSKRDLRKDEPFLEGIIDMVLLECFQDDSETEKEKESKAKSQNIYDTYL